MNLEPFDFTQATISEDFPFPLFDCFVPVGQSNFIGCAASTAVVKPAVQTTQRVWKHFLRDMEYSFAAESDLTWAVNQ